MSIPPILPLLETSFLNHKELAVRWHSHYPNMFQSYETALNYILINLKTSDGLKGVEHKKSSYNYAQDRHKTIKTGVILISGVEINRFEEKYLNDNNLTKNAKDDLICNHTTPLLEILRYGISEYISYYKKNGKHMNSEKQFVPLIRDKAEESGVYVSAHVAGVMFNIVKDINHSSKTKS